MFGHRRLAIIDLSHAADQPMTDTVRGHANTLVFNGEIYNFKALRRELEGRGEHFTSTGDTAVMLRLLGHRSQFIGGRGRRLDAASVTPRPSA
jgi:asparagine synthase (glutamine-hydrolysing)